MVLKIAHVAKQIRNIWKIFEMWCWRSLEKISWTNHVRNEEVLQDKEARNILQTIK
jgi:hypothetical protein